MLKKENSSFMMSLLFLLIIVIAYAILDIYIDKGEKTSHLAEKKELQHWAWVILTNLVDVAIQPNNPIST
ncbi:hypothetical protein DFA_11113 [Cavenderia fasciculata]|uniref:Uncharacterized protein n=1 Tax=Cavenderia fasciculata TaxID=261658 RepID=F4QEZ3_CACFS|nr:uncharacterized protein DFA_11113 [Cavenderia fasciculata]EGG13352.1 hypothetical protein DFA_11113 [Cavenderia fasciculata]|eukprot:XP_004350056.1 hypothetical protein DFA_11113 [Cavenderia fasciculata]